MNGKLARALRRAKTNTLELVDEPRIVRYYGRLGMLADMGPKFKKARVHKPKNAIKATWPATDDQWSQGRPVIVMHPVRHIKAKLGLKDKGEWNWAKTWPKHVIDRVAAGS